MRRVKRQIRTSPNPLFESWLKEWREEAKRNGSEMQYCFGKALKSLQKFPFKLETGKECLILEHFGAKICKMLDKRLNEYNELKQEHSLNLKSMNFINKNLENENNIDPDIVLNEVINKRKSCMDSPARILKCLRDDDSNNLKQNKKNLVYVPGYRSGGYAILLTLYKSSNFMTKAELEIKAQELCDAPFKKSDSHYTAWSSMSTLIRKGLVEKYTKPPRFKLTSKGIDVVLHLKSIYENKDAYSNNKLSLSKNGEKLTQSLSEKCANFDLSITFSVGSDDNQIDQLCNDETSKEINADNNSRNNDIILKSSENIEHKEKLDENDNQNNNKFQKNEETIFFLPNEFDLILYVDTQEMENKQNFENDKIVRYLRKKNVKFEVKHLNIGDYLWICRDRKSKQELVLPYIVERKRIDDLAMSIKDGRFHEQKFRLKQCGLQNHIYLVEKCGNDSHRLGLPLATIQQAISNTAVIDGFDIKITNDHDDSMSYLCGMTSFLIKIFKDKMLMSCRKKNVEPINLSDDIISLITFPEFNKDSGKMRKFTVKNMFIKHLLQLNGLSVEKAKAIVKLYPTPKSFIEALQNSKSEATIAGITYGSLNRCIGSALAKSIYRLYTSVELN